MMHVVTFLAKRYKNRYRTSTGESNFDALMSEAKQIADEFYEHVHEAARVTEADKKLVQRQACAGAFFK